MATKIRLMRLGKMRSPHYRVVVVDSRTKRDGRSIETIGKYHPKEDPSFIEIDNDRALYWLGVGAQPTEAVAALLRVTGTWQEFKGLPAPPPMLVKAPKVDKSTVFAAAAKDAAEGKHEEPKAKKAAKKAAPAAEAPAAEAPADEAPADENPATDDVTTDDTAAGGVGDPAQAEESGAGAPDGSN